MQASLARPSTGGVVSESFSASPTSSGDGILACAGMDLHLKRAPARRVAEIRESSAWARVPKMAVPMRTQVEPSSMATSKSCDMPMESTSRIDRRQVAGGKTVAQFAQLAEVRPGTFRIVGEGGTVISPRMCRFVHCGRLAEDGVDLGRIGRESALGFFAADVDFDQDVERLAEFLCATSFRRCASFAESMESTA